MTRHRPRPRYVLAWLAAGAMLLVAIAGCASRPTEAELTTSILTAANASAEIDLTDEEASCIAQQLLGSELSDTTLSGLAQDFDNPEVLETEVDDVESLVQQAAAACRS